MINRDIVFQKLKESKKYRYLCDETLYRISGWAVERYEPKKAVKAAKKKLYQVYGAYFEKVNINKIQKLLDEQSNDRDTGALKTTAIKILEYHTSTSERIPFMNQFYADLFSKIGKPKRVVDFACGLNPFSVQWMELEPEAEYTAYDIDTRLISIINTFFIYLDRPYRAECTDILVTIPGIEADVVFLLKTLPCLEQQEKGVSEKIIKTLKAKYIVISFPSESLTGKEKGMEDYYNRFILEILERLSLSLDYFRLDYSNEIFYVVRK
jgi:16S rRNA (guanine(1405)-N(7))-methyltransferase